MKANVLSKNSLRIIKDVLLAGHYRVVAAQAANVSYQVFCRWMALGEDPDGDPLYVNFRNMVLLAEAQAEQTALGHVMAASRKDPKHAEWFLSRKYPERWAEKKTLSLEGSDGPPIKLEHRADNVVARLSDDELLGLARKLLDPATLDEEDDGATKE